MKLKFENVDVEACLRDMMERNTEHYQSDFEYDKESFLRAARADSAEDKTLYWMSRQCGTWCFKERDLFIRESEAFSVWQSYKDSSEPILAYTVEITGLVDGKAVGTLFTQDYRAQLEHLDRAALTAATVTLQFEGSPDPFQFDYRDYHDHRDRIHDKYGRADTYRLDPEDPARLRALLQTERASRQKYTPGVFAAHIDKLIAAERRSITGRLKAAAQQAARPRQPKSCVKKAGPEL